MRENRRLTFRSIAEQVNIDRETVRKILTEDLDMRKVCAKMVPKELTEEQKQRRVFSYQTNNCVGTPCLYTGSSPH
jgi:predicted transcriptional regulator